MSFYHTAREHTKALSKYADSQKERAQKKKEAIEKERLNPFFDFRVLGKKCKTYRSNDQYRSQEEMQSLVPCSGDPDNLADRFDGRNMLDIIRMYEWDSSKAPPRQRTDDQMELDAKVAYEAYRELIPLIKRGYVGEKEGLGLMEAEGAELTLRTQAEMERMPAHALAAYSTGGTGAGADPAPGAP
eukprot:CAMPEP_0182868444 /NCGR_PEP_ID=MMETSP0034_2-20130328/9326_1 /TAXON_ID=156128 /ORGANISM="Nephroselmis pyriformis, Strain CCMP717" /LENGTH=185 /DNA_ID=CAMNT_0025000855 /DNA_START=101 /DNA_END=654 /DNA_ORIENTATION=+